MNALKINITYGNVIAAAAVRSKVYDKIIIK